MRDAGSIPGGGHGDQLQYSCLENPVEEEPGGVAELDVTEVTEHAYISLKAFFSRLKAVASTQENFESEIYWTF